MHDDTRDEPKIWTHNQPRTVLPPGDWQIQIVGPNPTVIPFPHGAYTVGAAMDNRVVLLNDAYVHRHHGVIEHTPGQIHIDARGATNGIAVLSPGGDDLGSKTDHLDNWDPSVIVRFGGTELWLQQVIARRNTPAGFHGIIGESTAIIGLIKAILRWAKVDATVLISGNSGTGKELVANALHAESRRKDGPFIAVDCGAMSTDRIEDDLFGHVKDAFTGANSARPGHFRSAEGGTIFLDEIHKLSKSLQAKLLRVLQEHEVTPLGTSKPQKVDVRVIAATNVSLSHQVARGEFLFDLFHRLSLGVIHAPDLVERDGDLKLLVDVFLKKHGKGRKRLSVDARKRLLAYRWPGNIRELSHAIERAVVEADGHEITEDKIVLLGVPEQELEDTANLLALPGKSQDECLRLIWLAACARHRGELKAAYEELEISKSTATRYRKEWGPFGKDEVER